MAPTPASLLSRRRALLLCAQLSRSHATSLLGQAHQLQHWLKLRFWHRDGPPAGVYKKCIESAVQHFNASGSTSSEAVAPAQIVVVQFETRYKATPFRELLAHNRRYALAHGYRYVEYHHRRLNASQWHASWERVPALLHAMDAHPRARFVMWLDSDAVFFDANRRIEDLLRAGGMLETNPNNALRYHALHGPARGLGFLLGGGDAPGFGDPSQTDVRHDWRQPPEYFCGGALLLSTRDPRSRELLEQMVATAGEYALRWPVDQHAMRVLLSEGGNETLRAGSRTLHGCMLGGADCSANALNEMWSSNAAAAPFIHHCLGPPQKEALPRVVAMAEARLARRGRTSRRWFMG